MKTPSKTREQRWEELRQLVGPESREGALDWDTSKLLTILYQYDDNPEKYNDRWWPWLVEMILEFEYGKKDIII